MNVTIVDYYSGNISSVLNSFKEAAKYKPDLNINIKLSNKLEDIKNADKLVLPGQGSFKNCINSLKGIDGLEETLKEQVLVKKKFILGICVGMQMFADYGEEDGGSEGLGWIGGTVKKMKIPPRTPIVEKKINYNEKHEEIIVAEEKYEFKDFYRLPHIGWNYAGFYLVRGPIADKFTNGFKAEDKHFYFVHSYIFHPRDTDNLLGETYYAGQKFMSAVIKENIIGTQFHPEKSGNDGLLMIQNFLTL